MVIVVCILIVGLITFTQLDWGAKELPLSQIVERARFEVIVPKLPKEYSVEKSWIVWVPKQSSYPDQVARQAVRFEIVGADQLTIDVIQAPETKTSARRNLGQIIGQGFFGSSVILRHPGDVMVVGSKKNVAIGVISRNKGFESTAALAKQMKLFDHAE